MPNEKSAIDEFLSDLQETKSPFKQDADPFKEVNLTSEEEIEEVEEEKAEKSVPFHKDPKIQRYVQKEIEKAIKDVKPTESQKFEKDTEDNLTDVLTKIIGNDTPEKLQAIKEFRRELGSLEEKGAQRALKEFEKQAERSKDEDRQAQQQLDDYFEEIEETYDVDLSSNAPSARKTRSEFVDYVRKIAPKNEEGEVIGFPDLVSSFEEFQERQKRSETPNRAKKLAARGMTRSTESTTPEVGKDQSWRGVDRFFSKLS